MDPFKEEKFPPTEDGLGKLSNTANLIAIIESSLKLTTNKLLQKKNPETIRPISNSTRGYEISKIKKRQFFFVSGAKIIKRVSPARLKTLEAAAKMRYKENKILSMVVTTAKI
jgi:hypothetical protein